MVLDFVYSKISVWQIYLPPVACTGIRQRGVMSCGGDKKKSSPTQFLILGGLDINLHPYLARAQGFNRGCG